MLASPLLRVAVRKGKIMPLFCTQKSELELAQRILEEFEVSYRAHEKKSKLYNRISAIESAYNNDYKLVRGLCALLERRCTFNANSHARSTIKNGDSLDEINNTAIDATALSITDPCVVINPIDIRRMLFEESSKRGFALTEYERNDIFNTVSKKLHINPEDVKRAMWSDLDENLVLDRFEHIDSTTLVGWYNLSLMQTLLFNATRMEFYILGGIYWKRILRNVKRLGLMYYLENRQQQHRTDDNDYYDNNNNSSSLVCSLEGPLSLFKLTDRYGTSLAKLLPSIVLAKEDTEWYIDAWVMRKTMTQGKKLYQFKISNKEVPPFLADPFYTNRYSGDNNGSRRTTTTASPAAPRTSSSSSQPSPPSSSSFADNYNYYFDSTVEEKFARKFNEVVGETRGWKLVREPDPLIAGDGKAFIPDFLIEKYGNRVYLEIVGFWTPEYLQRKLQKVKQIMNTNSSRSNYRSTATTSAPDVVDLFIAVSEDLVGSKIPSSSSSTNFSSLVPAERLIFYKNDSVPIRPILDHLKAIDAEMIEKKIKDPNLRIEIDLSKEIISLQDIAREYNNLPIEIVSTIASRDYGDHYISVGSSEGQQQCHYLISKAKARKLESLLEGIHTFTDACLILSENAVPEPCHAELIEKLGYRVTWQSMDASTAVIEKSKKDMALT